MARKQTIPADGANLELARAAKTARMYRHAARELKHQAAQAPTDTARADLSRKARRMEKHARGFERSILRTADALIAAAEKLGASVLNPAPFSRA